MTDPADRIDAALDACQAALAAVRAMPGSQERADSSRRLSRELRSIADDASGVLREETRRIYQEERLALRPLAARLGISTTLAARYTKDLDDDRPAPGEEEPSDAPEPQPVVVAIVTCHLGVLTARRRDGRPPVAFISGEIEPGESPADAAIREVKEETGLTIKAGRIIGRRVHPVTGRALTYMAARPAGTDTSITVADEEELAAVQWMSFTEVTGLMGETLFEPVSRHLARTLEA